MIQPIERAVKDVLSKVGIDICYMGNRESERYIHTLDGAVSVMDELNIIQVGANDGKYNDPIYDWVKKNKEKTNIVLIEPLQSLIPYLEENYSYHASAEILNKAVSGNDSEELSLYGIKQKYWGHIDADYGKEWPDYRIATGVTTADKGKILQWASENIATGADPEDIIEKYKVGTISPSSIVTQSNNVNDVHVLQVDAEGMDDDVVYSFFRSGIYPNIVNIETKHLSQDSLESYNDTLADNGYEVFNYTSGEKLALRR